MNKRFFTILLIFFANFLAAADQFSDETNNLSGNKRKSTVTTVIISINNELEYDLVGYLAFQIIRKKSTVFVGITNDSEICATTRNISVDLPGLKKDDMLIVSFIDIPTKKSTNIAGLIDKKSLLTGSITFSLTI